MSLHGVDKKEKRESGGWWMPADDVIYLPCLHFS